MDVLLDFHPDVLESTTPLLPAFCLPITPLVQLAGEVVWISHRQGLGMPRHRKTRLLHWPAYRLLFLIRVLDWKQIVSFSDREQGVVVFFLFISLFLTLPRLLICGCWKLQIELRITNCKNIHTFTYIDLATNKPISHFRSGPALFLSWRRSPRKENQGHFLFQALLFLFHSLSFHFLLLLFFFLSYTFISYQNRSTSAYSCTSQNSH